MAKLLDEQDLEAPRTMDAFDAIELDVARGARPRDEGERPAGALEGADRVGHGGEDLRTLDDADVQVGDERQRAASRPLAAVEDDRARLGDGQRTAGDGAVEARRAPGRSGRGPRGGRSRPGRHSPGRPRARRGGARPAPGTPARSCPRCRGLAHGGAVVRDALGEARDGVGARGRRRLVGRRLERLALRYVAQRVTYAREDLVTRAQAHRVLPPGGSGPSRAADGSGATSP